MRSAEVTKHADRVNLHALVRDGNILKRDITTNAGPEIRLQLLGIYKEVRPILFFFDGFFFFIPKNWRKVIKAFVTAMDAVTGWEKGK